MHTAVLGCGNMGCAIISGLRRMHGAEIHITAWDTSEQARQRQDESVRIIAPDQWFTAKRAPEAVVLAVKPQALAEAVQPVASSASTAAASPLWISIAAGVSLRSLKGMLGAQARIVRVMPNTPSLIGEGFSAYALNERCTGHDEEATRHILAACGKAQGVPEKLMDAVTGLSGSGPAYVYLFVEALIEAGVTAGLPLQVAREAAVQTLLGAGHMIRETGEDPAVLKRRVMSPGGTTVEGLRALEHAGLRSAVIEAVRAAAVRSAELGA